MTQTWEFHFYPRSPCGERRGSAAGNLRPAIFLSTLSLRRATGLGVGLYLVTEISIHALLAESDAMNITERNNDKISIHALLAESDTSMNIASNFKHTFLSTLSLRRATGVTVLGIQHRVGISIHALLAESDRGKSIGVPSMLHFYPRSPCGERHP